jgi:hypothetical protein
MCLFLVASVLTDSTQQIHSLRAIGVMSSHVARALGLEVRALRKSAGSVCTVPPEIPFASYFIKSAISRASVK